MHFASAACCARPAANARCLVQVQSAEREACAQPSGEPAEPAPLPALQHSAGSQDIHSALQRSAGSQDMHRRVAHGTCLAGLWLHTRQTGPCPVRQRQALRQHEPGGIRNQSGRGRGCPVWIAVLQHPLVHQHLGVKQSKATRLKLA